MLITLVMEQGHIKEEHRYGPYHQLTLEEIRIEAYHKLTLLVFYIATRKMNRKKKKTARDLKSYQWYIHWSIIIPTNILEKGL